MHWFNNRKKIVLLIIALLFIKKIKKSNSTQRPCGDVAVNKIVYA
jgi:hypothetical protein